MNNLYRPLIGCSNRWLDVILKTHLRGFRETIFLAIKLNRTIVPPPFYKHGRTDESQKDDEGKKIANFKLKIKPKN